MAGGSVGSDPQNRDSATRSEQYQHGHHWNDEVLHRSFTRMSRPLTGREEHQRTRLNAFTRRRARRERIFKRRMK